MYEEVRELIAEFVNRYRARRREPLRRPIEGAENRPYRSLDVTTAKNAIFDPAFDDRAVRLFVAVPFLDDLFQLRLGQRPEVGVCRRPIDLPQNRVHMSDAHPRERRISRWRPPVRVTGPKTVPDRKRAGPVWMESSNRGYPSPC